MTFLLFLLSFLLLLTIIPSVHAQFTTQNYNPSFYGQTSSPGFFGVPGGGFSPNFGSLGFSLPTSGFSYGNLNSPGFQSTGFNQGFQGPYGFSGFGSGFNYGVSNFSTPSTYGTGFGLQPNQFGTSSYGASTFGIPSYGAASLGMPSFGAPSFGMPSFGAPSFGMPSFGTPSFGMPSFGAPSFGMPMFGAMPMGFNTMPTYGLGYPQYPRTSQSTQSNEPEETDPDYPGYYVNPPDEVPVAKGYWSGNWDAFATDPDTGEVLTDANNQIIISQSGDIKFRITNQDIQNGPVSGTIEILGWNVGAYPQWEGETEPTTLNGFIDLSNKWLFAHYFYYDGEEILTNLICDFSWTFENLTVYEEWFFGQFRVRGSDDYELVGRFKVTRYTP